MTPRSPRAPALVRPATVVALPALAALLLLAPSGGSPLAAPQQAGPDTLIGTIRTLDARRGQLRILTGVGLALRVVSVRITADTRATAAGAGLALVELRSGDVVRVTGGTRPEGRVAYTIERLLRAAPGAEP